MHVYTGSVKNIIGKYNAYCKRVNSNIRYIYIYIYYSILVVLICKRQFK